MESLFGMHPADGGEIFIEGQAVKVDSPAKAIESGLAFLTEDRKNPACFGAVGGREHEHRQPVGIHRQERFRQPRADGQRLHGSDQKAQHQTPTMDQIINNLSGGNQQKVLIARWLLAQPKILILDEPTRGIDVGAKAEIYRLISELANRGVAIILVSSELPEILGMSDRVMVMHGGRITGILDKDDADQEKILALASE